MLGWDECCPLAYGRLARAFARRSRGPPAPSLAAGAKFAQDVPYERRAAGSRIGAPAKEGADGTLEASSAKSSPGKSASAPPKHCGSIHFRLDYEFNKGKLHVTVIEAKDLSPMDDDGTSDPYIKVYLEPEKKPKLKTKVVSNTLCPIFNETFTFDMDYKAASGHNLMFVIYDRDALSKDDRIGQLRLHMGTLDLGQVLDNWMELSTPENEQEMKQRLGDICFSLRYRGNDKTGKLTVTILEAKNLKKMDIGGSTDPYIKIYLCQGSKRLVKKKTTVKRNTQWPYYNESFQFPLPANQMDKVHLVVSAWDYDAIGQNDFIGDCVLACDKAAPRLDAAGFAHWVEMMQSARPVVKWHQLRDHDAEQ